MGTIVILALWQSGSLGGRGAQDKSPRTEPAPTDRGASGRSVPATSSPETPAPSTTTPANPNEDEDAYRAGLARLKAALRSGDKAAIKALVRELSVPSDLHEKVLWETLKSGDPDLVLYAGLLLGRIGTLQTFKDALALAAQIGGKSASLGYGPDGRASQDQALLNAIMSNLVPGFLRRSEFTDTARRDTIAWLSANDLNETVTQVTVMTLLNFGGATATAEVERLFDTTRNDALRQSIVAAMVTTGSEALAVSLSQWYEAYPQHRSLIAQALATKLPPLAALSILMDAAHADLQRGDEESPALAGVQWLGRRKDAFDVLKDALGSESDPVVRRALVMAVAEIGTPAAVEVLLDVARSDRDAGVRGTAYNALSTRLDSSMAYELLREALERETDPAARSNVVLGVVNIAATGARASEARALLVDEIRSHAKGVLGANLVDLLLDAARRGGDTKRTVMALREALPSVKDPVVRAKIESLTLPEEGK